VAPAFFHRQGSPVLDYEDLASVMPLLGQLTAEGLAAVVDHLADAGHPAGNVAAVGFCMGGAVTFYAGTLHPLGAAVTFYGGGVGQGRFGLVDLAPRLQAPWLGHFGDSTGASRWPTSRRCGPRPVRSACRPRSTGTPTPITASTATAGRLPPGGGRAGLAAHAQLARPARGRGVAASDVASDEPRRASGSARTR